MTGLVWLAAATVFAVASVVIAQRLAASPDFDVFLGAQHTARPYDPSALAAALAGRAPGEGPRFFAYPPTFLWLTTPLRAVSDIRLAYGVWVAASALALMSVTGSRLAVLMMISPAVVFAGMAGQTTLFVSAAMFAGLRLVDRPILSGGLIGLACCIKPQLAGLAPLFLLVTPQWRAGLWAGLTGLTIGLAATLAFGFGIWAAWLNALPGFVQVNLQSLAAKELIHMPVWLRAVAAAGGLALTWVMFRRGREAPERMICAYGVALILSPHAIAYELAGLAPAALMIGLRRDWRITPAAVFLTLAPGQTNFAALALALAPLDGAWAALRRKFRAVSD